MEQSKRISRKVISALLSLLMVLSCFSGMSLTAYAAPTETLLTTITGAGSNAPTATSANVSYSTEGVATLTFSEPTSDGQVSYQASPAWGWWGYAITLTVTPAEGYTITKCVFYDDKDRTATDSEAPFVVETTELDKTPKVNGTPILANQSKGIKKIEVYGYATPTHTHSFTYSADGATLTATCSAEGCDLTDNKATLKIAAPDNLTYDKSAKAAIITDANAIQGTAKVQYQTKSGDAYGEATETAPTNAGTYKASITVGGATASVEYTIAKATPTYTVPTGLTATYGQTLKDVTLPTGWTWADNTASVGNAGTNTFKANFTPADTANYNTVNNIDVTVTVAKASQTAPAAPTEAGKTINSITLNTIPNGEYKCGAGDWQTSPTFTGLDQNKSYVFRQRYAADANHNASAGSAEVVIRTANHTHSFTYSSSNGTITATCNGAGTCDLTDNKVSFTLTAPTSLVYDGTDKKATLEGVDAFNAATGLNVSANDIIYNDLTNVVTETKNAGTYQALYTLQTDFPRPFVGITFTVAKANPTCTAPTGLTATYGQTLADVTLTNPSGNTAGTWAWADSRTSVGNFGTNTFKASFVPTDTTNYNTKTNIDISVTVGKANLTPTVSIDNWTYGQEPNAPSVSGNVGDGTVTYTYATKGSDNFSATVPTNAGNYTVKATIAATTNYNGATATADFTIAKADATPATVTANKLTCDGTEKALVAVTGEAVGGEMQYALGKDAQTAPEDGWSADIPAATNTGTYFVWYKVVADDNHNGSTPACVEVTIDPDYTVQEVTGLSGNGEDEWTKGGEDGVVITVKDSGEDNSFDHFTGVKLDGQLLTKDVDYTVTKSSTIVTLLPATLEKLSVGEHTVTVLFDNGEVNTDLTVKAANSGNPTSPQTGDNSHMGLWIAIMILSLCGFAAALFIGKKKRVFDR